MGEKSKNTRWLALDGLNRREFLIRAAALGLSASALVVFLEACGSTKTSSPTPPTPTPSSPPAAGAILDSDAKIDTNLSTPPSASNPTIIKEVDLDSDVIRINHLLRRAGFGASPIEMQRFISMGWEATVDYLIEYQDVDDSELESRLASLELDLERFAPLQRWWLLHMIYTKRPLQEKMVLFWHGLLTSSFKKGGKGPHMCNQNELFWEHALGRYDTLLKAVSRDPAMLMWLDSKSNKKDAPNENFARELMELFTMGIGNYTERDVRESARAFTGYTLIKKEFVFNRNQHDFGAKHFLGRTGNFDGDDIVDIIFEEPVAAEFISRKLFEFFAYDDPEPDIVLSLANTFRSNNQSIKAVVREILTSLAFYSPKAYRAKIKSPAELVASTVRILGIETDGGVLRKLPDDMGQSLFNPPDVSGWAGGPAWINSSNLLQRLNFANLVATARRNIFNFDPYELVTQKNITSAEGIVDYFISVLLDGNMPPQEREILVEYVRGLDTQPSGTGKTTEDEKLRSLVYLVLASPDYQLA